jgi:hypothetical protein
LAELGKIKGRKKGARRGFAGSKIDEGRRVNLPGNLYVTY